MKKFYFILPVVIMLALSHNCFGQPNVEVRTMVHIQEGKFAAWVLVPDVVSKDKAILLLAGTVIKNQNRVV